ncbi:TenA family protein [Plebeiibacterium sediminum]|uniref:TenA family protein n=1 Tax=Plebeiibacterium sediminum TaxID=2992112 RepID=A0AAE3SG65_9BACT|nr:TenA family protein [Plebeiobacterium sediminum]MCW3786978.1 TenA family protein [Plebeiobacterium sediminum]
MSWTEKAWKASESIYNKILELPFLHELMNGTLPEEKFYFYLNQDAIYLSEYGKILAGIATRLSNSDHRAAFLGFSTDTIAVESALHAFYLKDAPKVDYSGPSPSCLLYTGFLSQQLLCCPVEVAIAAVLPCFWIYQKVGDYILEHQTTSENRYQTWIDTYGGEEFAAAVTKALEISNTVAENSVLQDQMTEAFQYACKMEWMFWDSAYRKEDWPV